MRGLPSRLVLLGYPLGHSLSPAFQNAALASAGLPLRYETLETPPERLDAVLDALIAERAAGNVTVPHKGAVARRCARLESLAERTGAVNTFWVEDGRLAGDNTDVDGFDALARAALGEIPRGARAAIIGAGGGAAAVLAAIERWPGAQASVWNRHPARAATLAARFPDVATAVRTLDDALRSATVVVNATPIGLREESVPVPIDALPAGAAVLDLAYRPGETRWVREARGRGHPAADGLTMLLEQGALAFERWTGRAPDRAAMRAAIVRR